MADLASLRKRRAYIKGRMTILINYIATIGIDTNTEDIKIRLTNVERYRTEFMKLEDRIVTLNNDEELDEEFEDNYYKIVSGLNQALRTNTEPSTAINHTILDASTSGMHMDVKLPKLSIPLFTGDYTEWQSFHDLYCSTIHDNTRLTPSQKLQYLKGTLRGEAANLLKHFSITDANYIEALRKLRDRYDRKKHTIYAFIKNFMTQPSITTANSANVRQLLDTSDEIIRGLKALGEEAESRDHWLIHVLINKLDSETNNQWAQMSSTYDFPTVNQLFKFLSQRIDALDSIKCTTKRSQPHCYQPKPSLRSHVISPATDSQELQICALCPEESHKLFQCNKFMEMPIVERKNLMKKQNRCFNCLNTNHNVYSCKSRFRCRQCNRKHHTTLHENQPIQNELTVAMTNTQEPVPSSHSCATSITTHPRSALLPTALVKVTIDQNHYQLCRILLDSGSQCSFISEKCAQKLQLKRSNAKLAISGIGATTNGYTRGSVSLEVTPWNKTEPRFQIDAFVFSKLTTKQHSIAEFINIEDFNQYQLADPLFYNGPEIDIIVGADIFFEMLVDGKILTKNQLVMQNTKLGWIIAGKTSATQPIQSISITVKDNESNLENLLRRFWEVENIELCQPHLSQEEKLCEKWFLESISTDTSGRIKVSLPFKITPAVLGDSYQKAVQRMYAMERKFVRDVTFADLYKSFMIEYMALGHMKEVNISPEKNSESQYYLPHHGVLKSSSSTTKLRVVFDGSAKTSTGKSLNDCLAVGPIIQSSLYEILSRFRKHRIAITADIEKMYRQVLISDADTKFQRIIWRNDPTEQFKTYELLTVTYGTSSASYLATRAVIQATENYSDEFPQAVNCIKSDMYVDDLMTGADTLEEATLLKTQINTILSSSGFELRKWLSNEKILNDTTIPNVKSMDLELEESSINYTKVLGLNWNPVTDCFQFKVSLNLQPTITKRGILSEASRLFDPLGWLAPITIQIKIFFQSLWAEKLSWDDELPTNLLDEWLKIRSNLSKLENIRLARYLNTNSSSKIELHGFSDASKQAYAAVIYGKITNSKGESCIKLLSAKTKVTPVKQLSIPRLELCGALLLSKLLVSVKQSLKSNITSLFAWTDSTIVLDWLNTHPNKLNTFVGNRTGEILTHFNRSQWGHVETQDNPADCASRGLEPEKLQYFDLWWNGPKWLNNAELPKTLVCQSNTVEEVHNESSKCQVSRANEIDDLATRISKFSNIIRVLAYVYRYISLKLKRISKESVSSVISLPEIQKSQHLMFRHIQSKYFKAEIQLIKSNKQIPASSRLKYYKPFIDELGLLRVGGRIVNASITYNVKHPIILTAQDTIIEKLVREHHVRYLHAGPSLMMATLRQKYWILGGRSVIRKVIRNCVKCTKHEAKTLNQIMGQLPNPRVELIRPFHKVGVDYAGPFQTYTTRRRGQKPGKSYICLFVCLSTKAVHIELVSDLTTDAYLAALKRFIARRGICKEIHSDNGSNFIGARNHLYKLFTLLKQNNNTISKFLLADEIIFKMIPPSAPHFGGLWESAVKSVKHHLKRVTDGHILTIEEMTTLIVQIEAMLNSRPICALSDDDNDYLTPSHFLIGRPSTQLPDADLIDVKISRLSRWQLIQQMNQHIWRRWHLEYLTSLQQTTKWHKPHPNALIGNIVLIKDDNSPPCKWLMGKIVELHPGSDEKVRVVTLKTSSGSIKRPIHKLCLLPVS